MKKYFVILFLLLPFYSWATVKVTSTSIDFYYQNKFASNVSLLLSFDNYSRIYHMNKNKKDHSFNYHFSPKNFKIPLHVKTYYYKLLVDGIYTYDNSNPNVLDTPNTGKLSYFKIEQPIMNIYDGPIKIKPLTYRFFFNADTIENTIKNIFIVGNFNNWTPFDISLKKLDNSPTTWYVDINFSKPGIYKYLFIVDGKWVSDWFNKKSITNNANQRLSILNVP